MTEDNTEIITEQNTETAAELDTGTAAELDTGTAAAQDTESAAVSSEPERPEHEHKEEVSSGEKRRGIGLVAFIAGFAACIALISILTFGFGLGRFMIGADWEYYSDLDENYGKYAKIMQMIEEDPLAQQTPEAISDDVLKEIIRSTGDPYAEYFTEEEYKAFEKTYTGGYVGIGIGLSQEDDDLVIRTVYKTGTAAKAGIEPGDIILRVDGVEPSGLDDAVSKITGEAGTDVTVTVSRDGKELDFTMKRAEINIDSVGYAVSEEDPKVGYIRIGLFREGTDKEFKDAVSELRKKGCDKFILDLRDNGGGLTDVCIEIADYLLPACKIMTDVTKSGSETVYNSEESSADLKMVVLVNENTASASEILTAALKENKAAVVIGRKTYGKGVTQVSRSFSDGSAAKLTVSEYLTPKGNHVQGNGIEPDIEADDEDILDKALEALNK